MIEWFAKRATQKRWWYIITALGVIVPIIISKIDPGDHKVFVLLGWVFGSQVIAGMYCAICELSAEVLKLRTEISNKLGSG